MEHKPIRSFARRIGRITKASKCAISTSPYLKTVDTLEVPSSVPLTLDIGFGMGDSILALAMANPDRAYIGVEVHTPGVGRVLAEIEKENIQNIQVIESDINFVLPYLKNLDEVLLWFPDPWPKKRHHKRRIVQDEFLQKMAKILKIGGTFHMATDWQNYAEHMEQVALKSADFVLSEQTPDRPSTKFSRRGDSLGHGQWDIVLVKK